MRELSIIFALIIVVSLVYALPIISFQSPTPSSGSYQTETSIYINLSSSDSSEHYVVNNFDNSIKLWLRAENNVNDEFGINNATLSGASYASGKYNQTFFLDGINDYVNSRDSLMTSPGMICLWFKSNSSSGVLYGVQDADVGGNPGWYVPVLYLNTSKLYGEYGWYGSCNQIVSTNSVSDNNWHHVCLGYNGSYDFMYLDSSLVNSRSVSVSFNTYQQIGTGFTTGCWGSSGWRYFNGSIDEILFFNRTLSSQEVKALYNASANSYYNNFTNLSLGNHTFTAYAINSNGEKNITENRTISIVSIIPDIFPPEINFTYPTPDNGISTDNASIEINVSITETNLSSIIYNWNSTNFTFYNSSLVLMMNFDDYTRMNDTSLYGNNGTCASCPSFNSSGKYGGAYTFDGNDDSISINNHSLLRINGNMTVMFWIKPNSISSAWDFYLGKTDSGGWTSGWGFWSNNDNLMHFYTGHYSSYDVFASLSQGSWQHFAGVVNSTSIKIYKNGELIQEIADNDPLADYAGFLNIGSSGSNSYNLNGNLDEVRIWNRELSSKEVYQEYASNLNKLNSNKWYLYVNQSKNSTSGLSEGTYTYQVFASDVLGNFNSTELREITISELEIDASYPIFSDYKDNNASLIKCGAGLFNVTISNSNGTVLLEINNTNITAGNYSNIYSAAYNFSNSGTYAYKWHSWGNGTNRNYNSSKILYYAVNFSDEDGDNINDNSDRLLFNESYVNTTGISSLNITISGNSTYGSYNDVNYVNFYDSGNLIINFTHNFTKTPLDLRNISIIKSQNYIIVNLSGQLQSEYNKTLYIEDNNFISLCVKDEEIASISEITSNCDGANETDFTLCLNNNTGYSNNSIICTDEGSRIKVENLRYSAIRGTSYSISSSSQDNSGGSGGGNPEIICWTNWTCTPWSFCSINLTQKRTCSKLNEKCSVKESKPIEFRNCLDVLFDVKLDIKPSTIASLDKLRFFIDLKEINMSELMDIQVKYIIFDENKIKVHEETETIAIPGKLSYIKEIPNPDLAVGNYNAQVIVSYGKEQSASSSHPFKVVERKFSFSIFMIIIAVLVLTGAISFFFYTRYKLRKEEEKIKGYLKELDKKKIQENMEKFYSPVFKKEEIEAPLKETWLGTQEKDILTLLKKIQKDKAVNFVKKFLPYSEFEIIRTIDKLQDLELIDIIRTIEGEIEVEWLYHTSKVTPEMLNDDLRFKKDEGWDFKDASNNPQEDSEKN